MIGPAAALPAEVTASAVRRPRLSRLIQAGKAATAALVLWCATPDSALAESGPGPAAPPLWDGAIPDDFGRLLSYLPTGAQSMAMRRLMQRLLLSPGDPMWQDRGRSVQSVRAAKLSELAMVDDVVALAEEADGLFRETDVAQAIVDGLLLAGRTGEACGWADRADPHLDDAYRSRIRLVCLLADGAAAEALAATAAVAPEVADAHAVFLALVRMAAGDAAAEMPDLAWRSLSDPDALLLAVLALADRPVASGALRLSDPARLLAISRSEITPAAVRLEAAERVAGAGAMPSAGLLTIYRAVPFERDEYANALFIASRSGGPRVRALLMQTADSQADPQDALDLRRHLLSLARGERASLATMLALLSPIAPASRADAIAVEAARTYYAAGIADVAERWHAIARADALSEAQLARLAPIWPLDWLSRSAGEQATRDFGRELSQWLAGELEQVGDTAHYNAAVTLVTLEALGWPIAPDLWSLLPVDDSRSPVSLPVPSVWWRMEQAAAAGAAGMTALFALLVLGESGPADAHPVLLREVLSALVATGQADDARRLALEAIWAAGL